MNDPSAGWFPDPLGRHEHRYFNGTTWTADVADDGHRYVDPLGTGAGGGTTPARNGVATGSLVCGIIGMATAWVPFVVVAGFVLAVLGVVLGVRGLRRSRIVGTGRTSAITGIITGGAGIALSIVGVVLSVLVVREIDEFIDPGRVESDLVSCVVDGRSAIVEGTVTNRSAEARGYTVFVDLGGRTSAVALDEVAPDTTASWSITMRAPSDGECDPVLDVQGPFPFGIEMDRIDS